MWVACIYELYEGSYGHTYFHSEEKCKEFVASKNSECYDEWTMEEIEFEDDKERLC